MTGYKIYCASLVLLSLLGVFLCAQICFIVHESGKFFLKKHHKTNSAQPSSDEAKAETEPLQPVDKQSESEEEEVSDETLLKIRVLTDSMLGRESEAAVKQALMWLNWPSKDDARHHATELDDEHASPGPLCHSGINHFSGCSINADSD
jgi:hypothetical protein